MSNQLATESASAAYPMWTATELTTIDNDPGDNAVDFVVNAFSPKYLGSGSTVDGQLCTQSAVARVSAIGGTPTFSNLQAFGDTIATRQMQGSICADGWYIVATYDSTNGTRVRYTTNHGATWSGYVTVSSQVNGSGHMPGLWMSQRTPGLAVVSGFTAGTGLARHITFDESSSIFTGVAAPVVCGTGSDSIGSLSSTGGNPGYCWRNTTSSNNRCSGLGVDINLGVDYDNVTGISFDCYMTTLNAGSGVFNWRDDEVVLMNTTGTGLGTQNGYYTMGSSFAGRTLISQDVWETFSYSFASVDSVRRVKIRIACQDVSGPFNGSPLPLYIDNVKVYGDTTAGSAAYVTTNYGATWTEITSAATVGFIQPDPYLCGAIESPYTDSTAYRFVYGTLDDSGTYPVPRLDKVVNTSPADISPVADGKTYGVPYSAPHRRAICISVTDANTAILCGESRDASTGTSTYRVFLTRNLWATTPTWTPLTAESATPVWRGVYIAGDSPNVAYFLGTNGNFGYWNAATSATTIADKKGDSTNSTSAVGLCGF